MSKKGMVRTLLALACVAAILVSPFLDLGEKHIARAYVPCPAGHKVDVTLLNKDFHATEEEPAIINQGARDITQVISVQNTNTFHVGVNAQAEAEAGVILEKASVTVGVSVDYTFTSQKGVTRTFIAPGHTEYHVAYGTYVDHLYVHSYDEGDRFSNGSCPEYNEDIQFVDVVETSGAWDAWQKAI